jgi:hypothetical protein
MRHAWGRKEIRIELSGRPVGDWGITLNWVIKNRVIISLDSVC